MKNKITVSVGIAAFNEEGNIFRLVSELLAQKQDMFILEKIIIISDGSVDKTEQEVKKIKNKSVVFSSNKTRMGKSATLNKIIKQASTDVLIFMDADVYIKDSLLLKKLISPIVINNADIATAQVIEMKPQNTFQEMLSVSMRIKNEMAMIYRNGRNIYTCYGRCIALGKNLYKQIIFPKGLIADDAYLYLYAFTKGMQYQYVPNAKIFYTLPKTVNDHEKQSHRFLSTQKQLYTIFGKKRTQNEYMLPKMILLKVLVKNFFKNPILLLKYIFVFSEMMLKSHTKKPATVFWDTAHSSKII